MRAVIDASVICHMAITTTDGPRVTPQYHVRDGDVVYFHGHAKNAMLNAIANGQEACLSFTCLDGLVMGKTAAAHSFNYRSAVVYGHGHEVTEPDKKRHALKLLVNRLAPDRWESVRQPDDGEIRSIIVVEIPIGEASVKIRSAPPNVHDRDRESDAWAGVIPIATTTGTPLPFDEETDVIPPVLVWPE
ncbi:MAG: pyridoxamine 5'-phosphate oxidase family protein [Alphaproteobacteria bacterium]|nr:pyridoxamine 5'-phosphate oxidase family protein [Alphaproteobacteria bacterium]